MAAATSTTISSTVALAAVLLLAVLAAADDHKQKQKQQQQQAAAAGDVVARTCANVTRNHMYATWEDCDPVLRSDKRSATAKHPQDLALIALDLFEASAAAADARLDSVLRNGSDDDDNPLSDSMRRALRYCRLDFAAVPRTVAVCRGIVQEYRPEHQQQQLRPVEYLGCEERLWRAPLKCLETTFPFATNKVQKEVGESFDRAQLVKGMIEEMAGVYYY